MHPFFLRALSDSYPECFFAEPDRHGIDFLAVARIVRKYQGEYMLSHENDEFSVKVILPMGL